MFGDGRKGDISWEGVVAHLYFSVGGFDVVGFEGRSAHQAGVGDNSQTPDVDLVRVSIVGVVYMYKGVL